MIVVSCPAFPFFPISSFPLLLSTFDGDVAVAVAN